MSDKLLVIILLTVAVCCATTVVAYDDSDTDVQTISSFGLVKLSEYSHVGSQEVIFVPIPAIYLSSFAFEWTGVAEVGGGISQHCPDAMVIVLVRKWSVPIYDPFDADVPKQTWPPYNETMTTHFNITHSKPETKYEVRFSDAGNATAMYYAAMFLSPQQSEKYQVDGLSADCEYFAALTVKAYSSVPVAAASIMTVNYIQTLDESSVQSDDSLERVRTGLLNTVYTTEENGYNITRNSSLNFSWIVRPYEDVGGVLMVQMKHANDEEKNNTFTVKGCLLWGDTSGQSFDSCNNGYPISMDFSEENAWSAADVWYWPFPRSGLWSLDLSLICGVESGCDDLVTIKLDVRIIPCIDSCQSNLDQGECKLYRTDVLFFSACECKSGWQGIACTDGSNAIPRSKQLLITLMLTLSNLIFLPCTILAAMKRYYTEAFVYFFVLFFSSFYHACDNEYVVSMCIMKYDTLQFCDFLGAITAIWFTLIAIADLTYVLESWFHVAGLMAISVAVSYNRFSLYTFLIPVLCALVLLAVSWGRRCKSTHACYPKKLRWLFSVVPGILCALVGIILYAFVETTDNYYYVHSIWHILMGSSVLFLLPKHRKNRHLVQSSMSSVSSAAGSFLQYNGEVASIQTED